MEDNTDVCIRKKIVENGEEYMVMLDDEAELKKAIAYLGKKHNS